MPDAVFGAVIVALAFAQPPVVELRSTGPLTTVLMAAPVVILPWRRRWPLPVLGLSLALFGTCAAAGTLSAGIAIAIGGAAFQVAVSGPRTRSLVVGGCAVVATMLLTLPAAIGSVIDPRVIQFGLIVALAVAAGDGTRSRHAYIAAIQERAERAVRTREAEARRRVSEERLRIARDLHDAVAHQIAVISLNAGAASSAMDTRPQEAKESLATIRAAARTVLAEIGSLMTMLRADDDIEGAPAPQAGLDRLDELVEQFSASGLEVRVRIEGRLDRVSGMVSLVAYRVVQEALTNAHKHGVEDRAHILVHVTADEVGVTVTNPTSAGVYDGQPPVGSGLGLVGLKERVTSVRGTVEAGPAPAGWKLVARMPLVGDGSW